MLRALFQQINQVERWFGILPEQAIRRGSFTGVQELVRGIHRFVEQILAKVERAPVVLVPQPGTPLLRPLKKCQITSQLLQVKRRIIHSGARCGPITSMRRTHCGEQDKLRTLPIRG